MTWAHWTVLLYLAAAGLLATSWCWAARAEDDWQQQMLDELRARAALKRLHDKDDL